MHVSESEYGAAMLVSRQVAYAEHQPRFRDTIVSVLLLVALPEAVSWGHGRGLGCQARATRGVKGRRGV